MATGSKMARALSERRAMREAAEEQKRKLARMAAESYLDGTVESMDEARKGFGVPERLMRETVADLRREGRGKGST